tara:strand:- start:279 stop:506 length:228 start_codon:yes stop_codon:yes gene_type:complete
MNLIWHLLLKKFNIQPFFLLFQEVLNMALNDTFNILSKRSNHLVYGSSSHIPIKDYWAEECKRHPSKKGCLFYCD